MSLGRHAAPRYRRVRVIFYSAFSVMVVAGGWQVFRGPSWTAAVLSVACVVVMCVALAVLLRTPRWPSMRHRPWSPAAPGEPVPPENVRVVMADGQVIPVDCLYLGLVNGQHEWQVVWTLPELPVNVSIGKLPRRTSVGLMMQPPPGWTGGVGVQTR